MTFTQTCTITARREVVWDFLLQAENVARCLVGVEAFKQLDQDNYEGTLRVKVGPIALALQGTLHVEARDREQWHGAMRAEAKDRRLGGGAVPVLALYEPGGFQPGYPARRQEWTHLDLAGQFLPRQGGSRQSAKGFQ